MAVLKSGTEIIHFLKSFEGAATACPHRDGPWSLWVPEISAGERPVTPASQIYFPVILRHGMQMVALRFFYDCGSGKIRFYTGAVPSDLVGLPEFEHAVSGLFRHSLPVEPIRQRKLRQLPVTGIVRVRVDRDEAVVTKDSLAEVRPPADEVPVVAADAPELPLSVTPLPELGAASQTETQIVVGGAEAVPSGRLKEMAPAIVSAPGIADAAELSPRQPSTEPGTIRHRSEHLVRVEICDHTRRFLQALIFVSALLAFAALGAYVYLQISEDPGVRHHRLQLEQMRIQSGR